MIKFLTKCVLTIVLLFAITIGALFLFADTLAKYGIEKYGTKAMGAKVELAQADLSFSPLGLSISRLQITDPKAPMTNLLEARRVAFAFDAGPLLSKRIIITDMDATGLAFQTPRESSGAVAQTPAPEKKENQTLDRLKEKLLPTFEIPDVDEIVEKENLKSIREAESIIADIKKLETEYKARIEALPDKKAFKAYERRLRDLKKGGGDILAIVAKAGEIKKLTEDIRDDLRRIRQVRKDLKEDTRDIRRRLKTIPSLAQQDYNHLKSTYSLDAQGVGNVTGLLFGDAFQQKVDEAIGWYSKLSPLLEKTASQNNQPQASPQKKKPLFVWVQKGSIEVITPRGTLAGTLAHLSSDPMQVGQPTEIDLSGKAGETLDGIGALSVKATLNHTTPGQSEDDVVVKADKIKLPTLGKGTLSLEKANADLFVHATFKEQKSDTKVNAQINAFLSDVNLTSAHSGTLSKSLQEAVAKVKKININATAEGPLNDVNTNLSSNLDSVLQMAVKNAMAQLAQNFDSQLKKAIDKRVNKAMGNADKDEKGLGALGDELEAISNSVESLF